MGNVIADFYCAERKLIVELDGDIHDFQVEEDAARSRQIESFGYRVIRFRNEDVEKKIGATLNSIFDACKAPLPELGEGWGEGA